MADIWPDHATIRESLAEHGSVTAWRLMQSRIFNQTMETLRARGFRESPGVVAKLATTTSDARRWSVLALAV